MGSTIQAGRDLQLNAGKDIHIEGSDVAAGRDIDLVAGHDILIESAQNTARSHEERRSVSYSYSIGTAGAGSGSSSWNAGASYGYDDASSITQRNSRLYAGGSFRSRAGQDTTFAGANVNAADLAIETGDDLTIVSRQNRSRQRGMDAGISLVGGGQPQGESQTDLSGVNGGHRSADRRWTDDMTTLIGRNSVNIKTGDETTLKGAMLAQINEDGSDGGNLSLNTGSLIVEDLHDRDTADNWNAGVSGSKSSSSVQFQNGGHVKGQTVHATIGQGDITLTKAHETVPEELNRDINNLTTVTANRQTGGANVDMTVDHRMLSKEGWQSIAQDFADTGQFGADVYAALKTISQSDQLGINNLGQALANNAATTLLLNEIARHPEQYGQIALDLASQDPVANQRGLKAAGQLLQTQYGVDPSEINFYDTTTSASLQDNPERNVLGATVVDRQSSEYGNIFLDVGDHLTSKETLAFTLGHEVGESNAAKGAGYLFFSDDEATREALNDQLGHRFVERMQDLDGNLWDTNNLAAWQQGIRSGHSMYTQYGNQQANRVGDSQVNYAYLRTPMSLAAQQSVNGRQWLGTESAERFAKANELNLDASSGHNFFGPVSTVLQQDQAAQAEAGVTGENAGQSALVLVEPGDTSASLEQYIVEQMGPRFEAVYQHSPELQDQVAGLTADAKAGEYLNVSPLWQWSVAQANQQAEQSSVYYADVVNKQGTVYDGSVPLFSNWLGGYGYNAAVTLDNAAPPAMQAYARNSLVYDLAGDALLLGIPAKGASSIRMGAVRYGEGVAKGPGTGRNTSRAFDTGGPTTARPASFPQNSSQSQHIFRDAPGHLRDTPANRQLLQGVANDSRTTLGTDRFGNVWSARTQGDGTQVWVQTRNGVIQNGGVNQEHRVFNPQTGLSGP